jgi:hypothetical protein
VFFRFKNLIAIVVALVFATSLLAAQETKPAEDKNQDKKPAAKPSPTPDPKGVAGKATTAEQVVDSALFIYGFGGGRATLNQIRKTTSEHGKFVFTAANGKPESVNYQRWVIRGESLDKEKIRLDQQFSNSQYGLILDDSKTYGVFNNTVFNPREEVIKNFEYGIYHGLEALFRYKENGSTIELAGREKDMGVEYYLLDVTDTKNRKTRFYVSTKTLRVLMLTYEEDGIKYKRKFYDQRYAQGTLVPYRSVLTANDKVVEEQNISSITFGQKVDEDLFKTS